MIQLKAIKKTYRTGNLVQVALNQVSLNFRDNEFVSILGASGSGKSTLLNIVGGLDRYDSGDLIINGISTNRFKDRDWDTYRNHSIGFVFQSYNLISHQSVLANVELSLTIAGVSGKEKKERAKSLLKQVGLEEQMHKLPSQLSGGQMQRVAIARALVNNPDILLADEPTGALDTVTSVQIMELLKEVAKDKLVIMVTHNPELAEQYSTRIVRLKDGEVVGDTNPYILEDERQEAGCDNVIAVPKKSKNASMSFGTALCLSFRNLCTKKGRTILTSFAGSIGIIGIALILALSSGVNKYIEQMQKDTMSSYPIVIEAQTIDFGSSSEVTDDETKEKKHTGDKVYTNGENFEMAKEMSDTIAKNDLRSFKKYLDNKDSEIWKYVGDNGVVYSYNTPFTAYVYDEDGNVVNADGSNLYITEKEQAVSMSNDEAGISMSVDSQSDLLTNLFSEISGETVQDNYDVVYGKWPTQKNQLALVLDEDNDIPLEVFYQMGLLPAKEYQELMDSISNKKKFEIPEYEHTYKQICDQKFYFVPDCDFYQKQSDGKFEIIDANSKDAKQLLDNALELEISAVIKLKDDSKSSSINSYIGYTKELTDYLIDYANNSEVVKAQLDSKNANVLDGSKISEESYEANLQRMGYVDVEEPISISIYTDSFEDKEEITRCIDEYNSKANDEQKIVYTDMLQVVISSVTTIVDVISYILIAFVAISLIVSSLMIGIITYISVLERRKEIGILRAVGASKRNIKQVFNAETVLVGAVSGIIGVLISEVFIVIINLVIQVITQETSMSAFLPVHDVLILIGLSMLLTLIGGLVPASKAAKEDPVAALRSE